MRILNVTFDCAHAEKVAGFWAELLGRTPAPGFGEHYAYLEGEPNLLFLQVAEGRVALAILGERVLDREAEFHAASWMRAAVT
jgi:Glyoxalase-like domain